MDILMLSLMIMTLIGSVAVVALIAIALLAGSNE